MQNSYQLQKQKKVDQHPKTGGKLQPPHLRPLLKAFGQPKWDIPVSIFSTAS